MEANIQASAARCSRALETSLRNVLIAASAVTELHVPNNLKEVGLFTARGHVRSFLSESCEGRHLKILAVLGEI